MAAGCRSLPEQTERFADPANPDAPEAQPSPIGSLMAEAPALQLSLPTNAPAADHSGHAGHAQPAARKQENHDHKEHAK